MTRKRLALLGFVVAAALTVAGVAAAHRGAPSVQSVTATFNATTVTQHSLTTCSINGGDTFQATRATYTGTATSADPRLAGTLTIRAWNVSPPLTEHVVSECCVTVVALNVAVTDCTDGAPRCAAATPAAARAAAAMAPNSASRVRVMGGAGGRGSISLGGGIMPGPG